MKINYYLLLLFSLFVFSSCEDKPEPVLPMPTIANVEIGLNNNEIGVIGRDFHLNADIVAGEKIDLVTVRIVPRSDESYASAWSHEVIWEQYKGARNTNVHKHFDIPDDAVEGKYDFLIIVTDENGTTLEEKRSITIYSVENIPVDPVFSLIGVDVVDAENNYLRGLYTANFVDGSVYESEEGIKKGEFFGPIVMVDGVKGTGKMYCLLIPKKHNHKPESVNAIDFSKVIVLDVWEHTGLAETTSISNIFDFTTTPTSFVFPSLEVGAGHDNNVPANPITGDNAWETGDYYLGVIYHNSTHNMTVFNYGDVKVNVD